MICPDSRSSVQAHTRRSRLTRLDVDSCQSRRRSPELSVVIPAINEEHHLGRTLDAALRGCRGAAGGSRESAKVEVIVVDAHSSDRTARVAKSYGVRVVLSPPGRARQMNAGAAVARGRVLLFLHADTSLPRGYDQLVIETLRRRGVVAAAFRLRIDGPSRSLRWIERAVHQRCRWLGMPYGDQAIFLEAQTFHRLNGFPDQPVMEDYQLVRQLRRQGRVVLANGAVTTSGRRWLRGGVWRTTLIHQLMIVAYHLGVSPARITGWRSCPLGCLTIPPLHADPRLDRRRMASPTNVTASRVRVPGSGTLDANASAKAVSSEISDG